MATVYWLDGFELYGSTADILKNYYPIQDEQTISTVHFRTGAQALCTKHNDRGVRWIDTGLSVTTAVLGVAIRKSVLNAGNYGDPQIVFIDASANKILRFVFDINGRMQVYRDSTLLGTTTNPVVSTVGWNYIEIKVYAHESAGTVEIRLNGESGTPELSLSGIDTIESAATLIQGFELQGPITYVYNYWDDLYFASDFLGDSQVDVTRVTGAGNYSQFTPSAGNNEDNVDESPGPDDDTTYNDGDAIDEIDTYQMGDLSAGGTIHAFKIQGSYRKTEAGVAKIKQVLRINGSDYLGAEKVLTTDFTCEHDIWNVNPDDSAAFETADINALEPGVKVTDLV